MSIWIGQVVRPDGTVLTENVSPEPYGPSLYWPRFELGEDPIRGEAYGRWRLSDAGEWQVTYWWPNGPGGLPAFCDHTGNGEFVPVNADEPNRPRGTTASQLKTLKA
jgi:hypothetical protein